MHQKYFMQPTLTQRLLLLAVMVAALWLPAQPVSGGNLGPVLTQHNDVGRTGAYLAETSLNTTNVNAAQFGKLFVRDVDGQIYAQPLYVPGVALPGGPRNVVYVASMHNSVYAFDAEDPDASQPLWQVSLGLPAPITYTLPNTSTIGRDFGPPGFHDISGEIGVLSTPVVDPNTDTLYVVALTREPEPATCPCQYAYRLYALNLASGAEKFGGPVVISGTVPGSAGEGKDGIVSFLTRQQNQRTALLLQDGVIYVGFASFGDYTPYHGWVFGYDAATLAQVSAWNATPNSGLGGIWQSGQGLAADTDGQIYLITGNGHFEQATHDYADSFVKLDPHAVVSGVLPVASSFTPNDQQQLESLDADLGSGGPLIIPGTGLIIGLGKAGKLYLVDKDDMGGYQEGPANSDRVIQSFQAAPTTLYPLSGTPVYWNSPSGPRFYLWPVGTGLKAYGLTITNAISANIQTTPIATSTTQPLTDLSGGYLSLSANGSGAEAAGTGIVWAVRATAKPGHITPQSVLYAFDAQDVAHTLWTSEQNSARDAAANFAKFGVPTIANGRVYLASFSNELLAYGLLAAPHFIKHPLNQNLNFGQPALLSAVVSGRSPLSYQWYLGPSGDTQHPVGTNSANFTTPPLALGARYWVRARNDLGSADSDTAIIEVAAALLFLPIMNR
jgi:hypothetical protein